MEPPKTKLKSTHPLHPENQNDFITAIILTFVLFALVYGFVVLGVRFSNQNQLDYQNFSNYSLSCPLEEPLPEVTATINEVNYTLEVAATYDQRVCGLSNKRALGKDEGMLFLFEKADKHGIWMKDMRFAIDIIWMDETYTIVHLEENAQPDSYPEVFTPSTPASYILEINAGQIAELGLSLGDTILLPDLTQSE